MCLFCCAYVWFSIPSLVLECKRCSNSFTRASPSVCHKGLGNHVALCVYGYKMYLLLDTGVKKNTFCFPIFTLSASRFSSSSFLFPSLLGTFKLPLIELETILPGKDFTLTARCFSTIIEVRTRKTPRSFDYSELHSCAALSFSCVQFCDQLSLIWKLWWISNYVLTLMIIAVPLKMEEADFCAVQHHNSFFKTQRSFSLHQQLLYSLFLTSGGFSYCHCGFAVQEKIVGGISAGKKLTPFHVTMRKLVQLANASQADS